MPKKILVVDDNPLNANLAQIILTRAGYAVSVARDGFQAIQALKLMPVDLCLIDISMPGMIGKDLCALIRASDVGSTIKLIAHTAMAMPSERESLVGIGFDDIVIKPASREVLLAAIENALK
jgi:CheY-like chemotaxis protein